MFYPLTSSYSVSDIIYHLLWRIVIMIYRLLLVTVFSAFFGLVSISSSFAENPIVWTPQDIYSLKGKVLKKRISFPVDLTMGAFKMAGFFYFKVEHVYGCLHHTERKWAKLCLLRKNVGHKPLQTVIHGLTYNHRYWDSKRINGNGYSYARFMARKGFIVLALDLLGSGKSDVPNGNDLNITESVSSIAQVLLGLKSGQNPLHRSFKKVILVGHSLGSILSVATLGTFPQAADALVVTGWAWTPHEALPEALVRAIIGGPPYVQLPEQSRTAFFYFLPQTDPLVIQFDNVNLIDQTPKGIFTEGLPLLLAMAQGNDADREFIKDFSRSNLIRVPVLIQLGEFDVIAPSSFADEEADFYPMAPLVKVQTLSDIGHVFNLHENNRKSWKMVKEWLDGVIH